MNGIQWLNKDYILRIVEEPYRIFFPLSILMGVSGVGYIFSYAHGWIGTYSGAIHAAFQIEGYMAASVLGFLLTAMPRFAGKTPARAGDIVGFLVLTLGVWLSLMAGSLVMADIFFLTLILNFLRFTVLKLFFEKRLTEKARLAVPPVEFVWIGVAVVHAIIGILLTFGAALTWLPLKAAAAGRLMLEQGFMFSIVAGVGGYLAPRLMGRTEKIAPAGVNDPDGDAKRKKRIGLAHMTCGLFIFLSFLLEGEGMVRAAYGIRALVVTVLFYRNRAWPWWPRITDTYVKMLWISIGMVILGHWAVTFMPGDRKALLHMIFLGGYSLMTFSVATMVVLSHSGDSARLRTPVAALRVVAAGIPLALIFRLAAFYSPETLYFYLLSASAFIWMLTAVLWLGLLASKFLKIPDREEFEKAHEEAKQRVLDAARQEKIDGKHVCCKTSKQQEDCCG